MNEAGLLACVLLLPSRNKLQWSKCTTSIRLHGLSLQLRGQLSIWTRFPFNLSSMFWDKNQIRHKNKDYFLRNPPRSHIISKHLFSKRYWKQAFMNCNEALLKKLFREDILSSCPKKNTFVKNIFDENPCSRVAFIFLLSTLFVSWTSAEAREEPW